MEPEQSIEFSSSGFAEKTAEVDRPKALYRGYIPRNDTSINKPTSEGLLEEIMSKGLNPHSIDYANNFTWTTPDKEYAKGVVTMRCLVRMATDEEYNSDIRSGDRAFVPVLAAYDIKPETKLYNAEGKTLTPLTEKPTKQIIIDNVQDKDCTQGAINEAGITTLIETLDLPFEGEHLDTIWKATMTLDKVSGGHFLDDHNNQFENKTMGEVLREASSYYQEKGLSKPQTEEFLAKGMFAGALEFKDIAQQSNFDQRIE